MLYLPSAWQAPPGHLLPRAVDALHEADLGGAVLLLHTGVSCPLSEHLHNICQGTKKSTDESEVSKCYNNRPALSQLMLLPNSSIASKYISL